jgi:hypothetical protein
MNVDANSLRTINQITTFEVVFNFGHNTSASERTYDEILEKMIMVFPTGNLFNKVK